MGFNEFLSKIFGNKAERDLKEIKPIVEKIKAVYPSISKLSNDELRARTAALRAELAEAVKDKKAEIEKLKAKVEETEINKREQIYSEIDKIEKKILNIQEEELNKILPEVFSIVKDTARRFAENSTLEVTATDFDRDLAAKHDFVTIEGDKAIYSNQWEAGGNMHTWDMVHYDVQLIGGIVLLQYFQRKKAAA